MEIQRNEQTQTQTAQISPEYAFQETGSVGTSETTLNIGAATASILVKNSHASNNLLVRFKSSKGVWNSKRFTIAAGAAISLDIRATAIKLLGSGAATTYEVLATKE